RGHHLSTDAAHADRRPGGDLSGRILFGPAAQILPSDRSGPRELHRAEGRMARVHPGGRGYPGSRRMTRDLFLAQLRLGLDGLPKASIDEIVADYETHFADGL